MDIERINQKLAQAVKLINESWHLKPDLLAAPIQQEFDISGISTNDVHVVRSDKGPRLHLRNQGDLSLVTFAPDKLLQGICAGDFTDDQKVEIYYPHYDSAKKISKKTVLSMKIEDARMLARECFVGLGILPDLLPEALSQRNRYVISEATAKTHARDIINALKKPD